MLITLTTDFGLQDSFVGIMKGVIARINPRAAVVDLTHGIPPQNVRIGALTLRHASRYFPSGTIHVAVVDPGVGSERRPLLIRCHDAYFIGPDNGLLSLAVGDRRPEEIVCLSNPAYQLEPASATFHGRDVFAPVAAHVSSGVPAAAFGEKLESFQQLPLAVPSPTAVGIEAEVIYIDHFGNLFTNVEEPDLSQRIGRGLEIILGDQSYTAEIARNYTSAQKAKLVALRNSWGVLEIAAPGGSAQRRMHAKIGDRVKMTFIP